MTTVQHDGLPRLVPDAGSNTEPGSLCSETVHFFDIPIISSVEKKMTGPILVSFCVVKGGVQVIHIFGHFWGMMVHVQSLETVLDNSGTSWVISRLTIGLDSDRSVCTIDRTSLADTMIR